MKGNPAAGPQPFYYDCNLRLDVFPQASSLQLIQLRGCEFYKQYLLCQQFGGRCLFLIGLVYLLKPPEKSRL